MLGPAYLATLETAIPFMAGDKGICPQMSGLWGDEECWGEAAPPHPVHFWPKKKGKLEEGSYQVATFHL